MKNCVERMKDNNTEEKISYFHVKQKLPHEFKVNYARLRALEFQHECDKREIECHVSIGGLDSITLYLWLKSIGIHVPGISVSYLEDRSIQKIHKQLGLIRLLSALKPDGTHWNKVEIIKEFGFPVLSKETASKIELLQNPTPDNATVRHAIITGETGEYGGYRKDTRMKMAQRWLELFAGGENEREGVNYKTAPFLVSSKCCYYLKEKPCDDWAREHNSVPYLGLMASEGGRRQKSLMINGCNYFGESVIRSAPFAIFNRQDILQLALDLNVPVPEIYGTIERKPDGTLYTTRAQRTGCSMCGFGIQLEERPHRFDRLYEDSPKEWNFWMNRCVTDDVTGEVFGWGCVLDYCGIHWTPETLKEDIAKQNKKKAKKDLALLPKCDQLSFY
jgi:3'-phosphoadenosine 5'-phosphosulfate sulfotransferase (PAPS reductase)/FAD synthetase